MALLTEAIDREIAVMEDIKRLALKTGLKIELLGRREIVDQLQSPALRLASLIKARAVQLGINEIKQPPADATGQNEKWGLF